jgi:hypothetical protein
MKVTLTKVNSIVILFNCEYRNKSTSARHTKNNANSYVDHKKCKNQYTLVTVCIGWDRPAHFIGFI